MTSQQIEQRHISDIKDNTLIWLLLSHLSAQGKNTKTEDHGVELSVKNIKCNALYE